MIVNTVLIVYYTGTGSTKRVAEETFINLTERHVSTVFAAN